ncbi:MAG: flagellin hook IN motif-containing protein [Enterocloster clostridioformis]
MGNVTAEAESGTLKFKVGDSSQSLTINESDPEVRSMLGILNGASNKLSLNASLWDNKEKLGLDAGDFDSDGNGYIEINKTKIKFTKNTTINELMDKINNNKEIGVKASYLSTTNQFVLVADETGKRGRLTLEPTGRERNCSAAPIPRMGTANVHIPMAVHPKMERTHRFL